MSARDRVVGVVSARIEAQAVIAENRRLRAKETLYAGQNRVQPLGAETPIRPRGLQANSGLPIGAPVQFNQGLAAATPRLGDESTALLQATVQDLGRRNAGFQSGAGDPNVDEVPARYPYDAYVRLDGSGGITAIWIWSEAANPREWKEFSGGGLGLLTGDGPPSDAIGDVGDLYLDIGYPDGASITGVEALRLYIKFASYPSSTESFWYEIGRRAVLGAPTRNPLFDGKLWTTRGGMTYVGWGSIWRRPNRHTYGPNPPDLKQVGDTHTVPTEVGNPVTRVTLCVYEYDGMDWIPQGCDCPDCGPAPPEEPYPDDYPIDCFGVHPEGPFRPYPDGTGGFVCTYKDPGLV